jgi:hypothetical protein
MFVGGVLRTNQYYRIGAVNSAFAQSFTPVVYVMARPTELLRPA